jgi:rSAM/selenodomain-associated transferase 2
LNEAAARISVIVPARNEGTAIAGTLSRLREPEVLEVVVVDGESIDRTAQVACTLADHVVTVPPGRARQMNAGVRATRGDILFFLHADTAVPPGFGAAILSACAEDRVVGGRFDVDLDAPGAGYRLVSAGINLRSRWTKIFTGDQGLFVRRTVFDDLGGFPEIPLLEDVAFSIAMKRAGKIACLRERLRTSPRRWQKEGLARTVVRMWLIRALYSLGVSPERLAGFYRDVR